MSASATTTATAWSREKTDGFIQEVMKKWEREGLDGFHNKKLGIRPGKKYDKIVASMPAAQTSASVWAFVERATGNLYKAAGWSQPAKGVRYRLADAASYEEALHKADTSGGFLYIR